LSTNCSSACTEASRLLSTSESHPRHDSVLR
jgi:hypothetical protein